MEIQRAKKNNAENGNAKPKLKKKKAKKRISKKKTTKKKSVKKKAAAPRVVKAKREFPRASLAEAIRIPLALKEYNGGNPWDPAELANVVDSSISNKSVTSNAFFYLTAAARDFGFTSGSRDATEIGIEELGKSFAYAGSKKDENAALEKAFLSVELFRKVFEHYKTGDLPEKKYVANTLESTFGLATELHDEFLDLYRENVRYIGIGNKNPETPKGKPGSENSVIAVGNSGSSQIEDLIVVAEPDGGSDKVCFVAIPFRCRTDRYPEGFFGEVLSHLIGPAGARAGFRVVTANQTGTDVIQSTIINSLLDSDLVIVDLTEHNPNVLFELGVRMAADKPVALIRSEGTAPIFDVDNILRVFDYSPNLWKSTIDGDLPNLESHIRASWDRRNSDRTYMKILRGNA